MKHYKNFQEAYAGICKDLLSNGDEQIVRNSPIKELIAYSFAIENPRDRKLELNNRNKYVRRYSFGELLWYLNGDDTVEFIDRYSKMWKQLSDDGKTNNSAYGKYIFGKLPKIGYGIKYDVSGCDVQWDYVKKLLIDEPSSRQAVIHIKPIQMYDTKDCVCTLTLQFLIRNNKLNMIVNMRSNDVLYGLTYDAFMFTILQELMASELNVELGTYFHYAGSMHLYLKNEDLVRKIIEFDNVSKPMSRIPSDFRENDLPILNEIDCGNFDNLDKLSDFGKELVEFLEEK